MPENSFKKICRFLDTVIEGRQKVRRREAWILIVLGIFAVLLLAPAAVVSQPVFGYSAVIYLAAALILLVGVASRAIWIIKRPPARERVALEIESERQDFGNNLISSLQLFPTKEALKEDDPTSPELIDALVTETAGQVEGLDLKSFVSDEAPRRLGRLVAALGATAVLIGLLWPGMYPRAGFLLANAVDLMPSRITHLFLSASAKRILPGSSVAFEVRTEGRNPGGVDLEFTSPQEESGKIMLSRFSMDIAGENRFRFTWKGGKGDTRVMARAGRFVSAPIELKVVTPPRTEMVEVVNFPPEYTGLQPQRGADGGNIQAYLGSSVLVRAKPNKPVSEALIALADGWKIPLKPGKSEFLEGLLLVGSPGSYYVRLKDHDGFVNLAPSRYRIDIIPDSPPEVKIIKPAKDLIVEAGDAVQLRYRASDDFGVRVANLEVQIGKKAPRRIRLWGGEKSRKVAQGKYVIDVRVLGLRPGESLTYRVIAEDTDTVSGPKWGTSPYYKIRIRNREAVIASLDKELKEISSKLLDLLGDYLEDEVAPPDFQDRRPGVEAQKNRKDRGRSPKNKERASLREKAAQILHKVLTAKSMLRSNNPREALANMDLNTLAQRLKELMNRHLLPQEAGKGKAPLTKKQMKEREDARLSRREEATETIERLASMGEDILRNVRMDRAGRTADAMMRRQESLARALEEMRKSGEVDEEAKQRFGKELARLQKEMEKLMRQLSSLAQRMPSEFMNQRGMRNLPMRDMMQAFNRIRQQMAKGNIRGALDSLRRLMSQIRRMRNAMRRLRRNQMQAQRGGGPMRRRQNELAAIVKEQQSILDETTDVFDSAVQRLKKGWPKGLKALDSRYKKIFREERSLADKIQKMNCEPFAKSIEGEQLEKRKEQLEQARSEHRTTLGEIELFMEKGEWGEVYRRLGQIEYAIQSEPCLKPKEKDEQYARWERGRKWLSDLLKEAEKRSPPKERESLKALRKRQKALEGRLAGIEDRVRRLMQLYPFIDPNVLRRLNEAKGAMQMAENSLGRTRASSAIPHEERVIELLAQGQNAMQQSMQQMAQRGSLGMGTPRGFGMFQRPGPGRGWWAQNPTLPGQDTSKRRGREGEDGQQGIDFSEVQIPDREQYKVPEKFREEVMEALKEGLPESLRQEIENYYERLTR